MVGGSTFYPYYDGGETAGFKISVETGTTRPSHIRLDHGRYRTDTRVGVEIVEKIRWEDQNPRKWKINPASWSCRRGRRSTPACSDRPSSFRRWNWATSRAESPDCCYHRCSAMPPPSPTIQAQLGLAEPVRGVSGLASGVTQPRTSCPLAPQSPAPPATHPVALGAQPLTPPSQWNGYLWWPRVMGICDEDLGFK